MEDPQHTVLCVDDEKNILQSLRRLLRKEDYRLLIAPSGEEGFKLLRENSVNVVISDQRMPQMTGTEFLSRVKEEFPEAIRIILTGYTEIDSIMESINMGHIYKFFLKPWNDQNLKLEIKQALEQYDLIQANKGLNEQILEANDELKVINENLELIVKERTEKLEIQNKALELSRTVLKDLPFPIFGVSAEKILVLMNREATKLSGEETSIGIGASLEKCFSEDVGEIVGQVLETGNKNSIQDYVMPNGVYSIDFLPLSGEFSGKGVVMVFRLARE